MKPIAEDLGPDVFRGNRLCELLAAYHWAVFEHARSHNQLEYSEDVKRTKLALISHIRDLVREAATAATKQND